MKPTSDNVGPNLEKCERGCVGSWDPVFRMRKNQEVRCKKNVWKLVEDKWVKKWFILVLVKKILEGLCFGGLYNYTSNSCKNSISACKFWDEAERADPDFCTSFKCREIFVCNSLDLKLELNITHKENCL